MHLGVNMVRVTQANLGLERCPASPYTLARLHVAGIW